MTSVVNYLYKGRDKRPKTWHGPVGRPSDNVNKKLPAGRGSSSTSMKVDTRLKNLKLRL